MNDDITELNYEKATVDSCLLPGSLLFWTRMSSGKTIFSVYVTSDANPDYFSCLASTMYGKSSYYKEMIAWKALERDSSLIPAPRTKTLRLEI